jgi:probable rRNA maturation factor
MINQQDRVEFTPALEASLRGIADEAAQRLGISSSSELSLLLVDNEYIKELNFMYRGKDEATDVLSFAMNELGEEEPELEELDDINMLGDIVISVEQAWHQSQEYQISIITILHQVASIDGDHLLQQFQDGVAITPGLLR